MTLTLFIAQVLVKYSSIKQTEPPSATQPSMNHTDVPDPSCATCPPSPPRDTLKSLISFHVKLVIHSLHTEVTESAVCHSLKSLNHRVQLVIHSLHA